MISLKELNALTDEELYSVVRSIADIIRRRKITYTVESKKNVSEPKYVLLGHGYTLEII